jgi:hypothetical protein
MDNSLVAFAEVETMLVKLRRQAAKLLRSKTEAEVVQQLQEALNVLQGTQTYSEKKDAPSHDETFYVNMSEERGVKKRRLACAAGQLTCLFFSNSYPHVRLYVLNYETLFPAVFFCLQLMQFELLIGNRSFSLSCT